MVLVALPGIPAKLHVGRTIMYSEVNILLTITNKKNLERLIANRGG